VVICQEHGANCLHMVQMMPLPSQNPVMSCLIKVQTGFTLVPAYPGCPGKEAAIKRVYSSSSTATGKRHSHGASRSEENLAAVSKAIRTLKFCFNEIVQF